LGGVPLIWRLPMIAFDVQRRLVSQSLHDRDWLAGTEA